ncbi:MAG: S9 family peptidase [Planctomycetes bacterium]|nr:S9 family peptidase [Planctomycetota bacterium]
MALGAASWLGVPPAAAEPARGLVYPKPQKAEVVDEYHGVKVADPYRGLEDPDSEASRAWIEAENKITFAYLGEIPQRERIKQRLTQVWNYEKFTSPKRYGSRYFFLKNDGLQNQYVLYVSETLSGEPRPLLDVNAVSPDGTIALAGMDVTDDGKLLAYGLSAQGSDWQEWRVRDVESGKDRDDLLKWVKFSNASWTKDGKGFYYSRYDEPDEATKFEAVNYYQKLFYHRVGDPQSADKLVYERKDQKEWGFTGEVSDDGRYLVIRVNKGTMRKNLIFYKDLQNDAAPVQELVRDFEAEFDFIDNDGPVFWSRTDLDAPRYRISAIDTSKPDRAAWKTLIPEAKDTLTATDVVGDHFIASYLQDAHSQVKVFTLDGTMIREVPLQVLGTAGGFEGRRSDSETFYSFTSYLHPPTIYRYDVKTGAANAFRQPKVAFNSDDYVTTQVFYRGKDGTPVPMFISHKKGLKPDGANPTLLYGYGGFNISLTPMFRPSNAVWMEMGGIYAVANLRGGGEYGKEWHEAGMKLKKQNVFDDFLAAAEWLTANKYTNHSKLAIAGASNGGLLVGAAMTQRPDLFGACLPAVGVMDMLRFHKFTIGWAWQSDYGSSDNADEFKALLAYSPLHNLKAGTSYPPTLITTADHDDRVVPAHSFKFAAALQEANSGPNPMLIRIQTKAGHGAGKPTSMQIDEVADQWAFLVRTLGMTVGDKADDSGTPGKGKSGPS